MKKIKREDFVLLRYFVKHYSDIEFLDLWFDCCRGRDKWVSLWNNENEHKKDKILFYFVIL
jgi:hypothetical protein